jgi:hypothetical protein
VRPHPDVDLLALHALGEPVLGEDGTAHVAGCVECARTVADLTSTVTTIRGTAPGTTEPVDPALVAAPVPAHVWQGIADELGLDPATRPASVGPSSLRRATQPPAPLVPTPAVAAASATTATTPTTAHLSGAAHRAVEPQQGAATTHGARPPHDDRRPSGADELSAARDARRRPSAGRLLAVAAAGVAVGVAGAAVVASLVDDGGSPAEPELLAAADLEAFGAGEGTSVAGSARLAALPAEDGGEDRVLQVWLDGLPDTGDDFLEAWLIDPDTGAMVSLGVVAAEPGAATVELAVPRGLDVGAYALVDVSAEPLDGDPTHSGVSLVRGTLGT